MAVCTHDDCPCSLSVASETVSLAHVEHDRMLDDEVVALRRQRGEVVELGLDAAHSSGAMSIE